MELLATEQEALKTKAATLVLRAKQREEREKDLEQKQRHRRLLLLEITNILGSFPLLFLVFFLALFLGSIWGINIPDGAGCFKQNGMCQNFRFKQPKVDYKNEY